MNWAIKIISKTLMTEIFPISWGVTTKAFTVFEIFIENEDKIKVCEKPYYITLAAHIFTKIEFYVAKHWGFNI